MDTVVIGVSTDTADTQAKFVEKEKLNFPLLADSEKTVSKTFGVLNPKGFANRQTFVIDKKGVVRKIYTNVNAANHPDEVVKFVKENLAGK